LLELILVAGQLKQTEGEKSSSSKSPTQAGTSFPLGHGVPFFFVKKEITMSLVIVACIVSGYVLSRPVVRTLGL